METEDAIVIDVDERFDVVRHRIRLSWILQRHRRAESPCPLIEIVSISVCCVVRRNIPCDLAAEGLAPCSYTPCTWTTPSLPRIPTESLPLRCPSYRRSGCCYSSRRDEGPLLSPKHHDALRIASETNEYKACFTKHVPDNASPINIASSSKFVKSDSGRHTSCNRIR